uniref:Uncharacterized protein n=1 Tax=Caenorhabditis japonica TaxID=281687 RepID=A0A8R1HMH8_CAEJA
MGVCSSCLRLLLDAESDVKIHVIEPTSINGGEGPSTNTVIREPGVVQGTSLPLTTLSASTLQVPGHHRTRNHEPTDRE